MFGWIRAWSWPEWRLHPWRHAMALLAVAVGVGERSTEQMNVSLAIGAQPWTGRTS